MNFKLFTLLALLFAMSTFAMEKENLEKELEKTVQELVIEGIKQAKNQNNPKTIDELLNSIPTPENLIALSMAFKKSGNDKLAQETLEQAKETIRNFIAGSNISKDQSKKILENITNQDIALLKQLYKQAQYETVLQKSNIYLGSIKMLQQRINACAIEEIKNLENTIYILRGNSYKQLGKLPEAKKEWYKGMAVGSIACTNQYANQLITEKEFAQAKTYLKPFAYTNAHSAYAMGVVNEQLSPNNLHAALQWYRKALDLNDNKNQKISEQAHKRITQLVKRITADWHDEHNLLEKAQNSDLSAIPALIDYYQAIKEIDKVQYWILRSEEIKTLKSDLKESKQLYKEKKYNEIIEKLELSKKIFNHSDLPLITLEQKFHLALGNAYKKNGQIKKALQEWDAGIDLEYDKCIIAQANCLIESDLFDTASKILNKLGKANILACYTKAVLFDRWAEKIEKNNFVYSATKKTASQWYSQLMKLIHPCDPMYSIAESRITAIQKIIKS